MTTKRLFTLLAFALAYFLAAKIGLALAVQAPQVSAVWPPTGLAIAAVVRFGLFALPAIFTGALAANATLDQSVWIAVGIAVGNTAEAWLGALIINFCLRRWPGGMAFAIISAALLAPIVSATVGVISLTVGDAYSDSRFGTLWRVWWTGDALGALIVVPLLLTWPGPAPAQNGSKTIETAALTIGVVALCAEAFLRSSPVLNAYIIFPFLIWAAIRIGPAYTALIVVLCDGIAITGTAMGNGQFADQGLELGLVNLQVFIAIAAATFLIFAEVAQRRREAEEALREADLRKNEFLAILAHELRNPLQAITSAVRLLEPEKTASDASRFAHAVISRQSRHLTRLIDDLLDVRRVVTGKIELRRAAIDLAVATKDAVATLNASGQLANHRVEVDTRTVYVHADHTRIEQVVINLVSNAIAYTPPGGSVIVSVRPEGTQAVLTVRDSGIGVDVDEQKRVFELFFRGKREGHRVGGLGIGLTLVRRIVELHDGSVEVRSEGHGTGAEFVVRLPAATTGADSAPRKTGIG